MNIIIALLAIFGLQFIITQSDGPFGMIAWARNRLISHKHLGVFFYQLLTCPACSGWWSGVAIYLIAAEPIKLNWMVVWGLSGSTVCLILNSVWTRLHRE